jgi:hypothetical protein
LRVAISVKNLSNLDENDPQYELKKSLLEEVCPAEKKIGQFTLSPITDWAREYKTKDGMSLINGFYEWAGYGGSGDSPITREEIPPMLNWRDIRDFIEKIPLKLKKEKPEQTIKRVRHVIGNRKNRHAVTLLLNCLTVIYRKA